MTEEFYIIGRNTPRLGLAEKVRGEARYTADLKRPGMLHARILRSPHPHARIVDIDVTQALAAPGVHAVITHRDVPQALIDADSPVLDSTVRFVGEEVAAVAAESELAAGDALDLIRVGYEPLPAVYHPADALAADAVAIHPGGNLVGGKKLLLERGSVEEGFAQAARVFEGSFRTQFHAPGGMETRAALAEWDGDRLTVWKTSRAVHANDRQTLARVLGLALENVRVICTHMGGGFGNKDEGRAGLLAALLARRAGRPVLLGFDRGEEFIGGRNRQASENHIRIGVLEDGTPTAFEMCTTMNAGAYVASGTRVTRRTGQGALYLYTSPNARFEGATVYTNRPAGGSFRGLGAPLGHFALEVMIDKVAESIGMDPLDYRLQFHVREEGQPGRRTTPAEETLPEEPVEGGIAFSSNGLRACLLAGAERIGWRERRRGGMGSAEERLRRGMGMAMGLYKGGGGREAEAVVSIAPDGSIAIAVGNVDVGQGSTTVLAQIAAEVLQVPMEQVNITMADTETTPPAHITAGSTTTFTTGAAVEMAAQSAKNRLLERAAAELGAPNAVLEGGRFFAPEGGQDTPRGELSFADAAALLEEPIIGRGSLASGSKDYIVNSFCAHFCEVEVDMESGRIRILRYVAVHDSGRVLHPHMAENQVSGGVLQFLGIALREELLLDEGSGATLNPGFLEHKFTSIVDFPAIEVLFAGEPDPIGPFGAKALGEPPVVPVFAAVANAVANACGIWLHETPFTPQRVLQAIQDQSGGGP